MIRKCSVVNDADEANSGKYESILMDRERSQMSAFYKYGIFETPEDREISLHRSAHHAYSSRSPGTSESADDNDGSSFKSPSPVDFEDDLEDADVEELVLRKQLLLSALNQCDEDGVDSSDFPDADNIESPPDDGNDEECELRAALLGSLRTDEESGLRSSLLDSIRKDEEFELRTCLLGSRDSPILQNVDVICGRSSEVNRVDASSAIQVKSMTTSVNIIRATKVTMTLNEILASTTNAPKVDPVIIPFEDSDSSESECEVVASAAANRLAALEPARKRQRVDERRSDLTVSVQTAVGVKPANVIVSDPKTLNTIHRVIAVKQADVARAEQLVDHLKSKLKSAEQLLVLNKTQLKMYREKELAILQDAASRSSPAQMELSLKSTQVIAAKSLSDPVPRPSSQLSNSNHSSSGAVSPFSVLASYSTGTWLNIDEFLANAHLSCLFGLRKATFKSVGESAVASRPGVSLRWMLLTNERAPSLDFLRTMLFTNYFHAIVCPFELSGVCSDKRCPYEHLSQAVSADWVLVRLASLCPKALGLSESEVKDKQIVRARIQNILAKFKPSLNGSNNNKKVAHPQSKETELVHFVWNIVRTALIAEFNNAPLSSSKDSTATISPFNLSFRVSESSTNDETLSILSDQDVNAVVSSLTASTAVKTDVKKTPSPSVSSRLSTLCQILKCRRDYSLCMSLSCCLSEFSSARLQITAADFLLCNPGVVLLDESPALISKVVVTVAIFKLNVLSTCDLLNNGSNSNGSTINLAQLLVDEAKGVERLLPDDLVYLKMILIHVLCFGCVPADALAAALEMKRGLFLANWWSPSCSNDNLPQVESLLTSCVSACQQLLSSKNIQNGATFNHHQHHSQEKMQLVFSVLSLALSYRLRKSLMAPLASSETFSESNVRVRKTCEKFFAKLCSDFPQFATSLALLLAHFFAHFISPSCAIEFLDSQCCSAVRQYPSAVYLRMLFRISASSDEPKKRSESLIKEVERCLVSFQSAVFHPLEGLGIIGVSEQYFVSLLRVFCSASQKVDLDAPTSLAFRFFIKSMFCSSLSEKLLLAMSFAVRTSFNVTSDSQAVPEVLLAQIAAPYFTSSISASTCQQKQRYQLLAHALCCCLRNDSVVTSKNSNNNNNAMPVASLDFIEKHFDKSCLSNGHLLNSLIDSIVNTKSPCPDMTYLAGVACRLSCEMNNDTSPTINNPSMKPRMLMSVPCDDAVVRFDFVVSCL